MPTAKLEWTDAEDKILAPVAQLNKTTVEALILAHGKVTAIQSALASYAQLAIASGEIPKPIMDAILGDADVVFGFLWKDLTAENKLAASIAEHFPALVTKALADAEEAAKAQAT